MYFSATKDILNIKLLESTENNTSGLGFEECLVSTKVDGRLFFVQGYFKYLPRALSTSKGEELKEARFI